MILRVSGQIHIDSLCGQALHFFMWRSQYIMILCMWKGHYVIIFYLGRPLHNDSLYGKPVPKTFICREAIIY